MTKTLLAAAALSASLFAFPAFAHTSPEKMEPRPGAVADTVPARVRIWFDGELEPAFSKLRVVDAKGHTVSTAAAHVDAANGRLLEVPLQPLVPGIYKVYWRVVARDGHTTEGDYSFTVRE